MSIATTLMGETLEETMTKLLKANKEDFGRGVVGVNNCTRLRSGLISQTSSS